MAVAKMKAFSLPYTINSRYLICQPSSHIFPQASPPRRAYQWLTLTMFNKHNTQ